MHDARKWPALLLVLWAATWSPHAFAQSASWNATATTGGSWGDPANWAGGSPASGAGNTATFGLDFDVGSSVTLDGPRTIGTIESTSANPWSLDEGSGGILNVEAFAINGTGNVTVSADLAGTNFTKNGTGTLIISNADNAYTGSVSINAGTLSLIGAGNYASVATSLTIGPGATLDVTGLTSGLRYGGPGTGFEARNGDFITGTGTINGGLRARAGSTVYPGDDGVGTLNVNGSVAFDAGSFWQVRALSAAPGSGNSNNVLSVSGAMTLDDGMFMPVDGTGFTLVAGETYDYTIGTVTGAMSIGNVTFQPAGFGPAEFNDASIFSLFTSGNDLILRISPVPEPALCVAAGVAAASMAAMMCRRRRPR
jgi:autotransporter-associated beta strand protein